MTPIYSFRPRREDPRCDLLAAQSLIYNKSQLSIDMNSANIYLLYCVFLRFVSNIDILMGQ